MLNAIADKMLMGLNSDKIENTLEELSKTKHPQPHKECGLQRKEGVGY